MGIAGKRLDAFLQGGQLTADELKALALDLFGGHILFDPKRNVLMSANAAEPKPLGVHPPRIDPATLPKFDRVLPVGPQAAAPRGENLKIEAAGTSWDMQRAAMSTRVRNAGS